MFHTCADAAVKFNDNAWGLAVGGNFSKTVDWREC
jgi:hypothetical protein